MFDNCRQSDSNVPLLDLKAQYRAIKNELDAAVIHVLENAQFILGSEVAAFEKLAVIDHLGIANQGIAITSIRPVASVLFDASRYLT